MFQLVSKYRWYRDDFWYRYRRYFEPRYFDTCILVYFEPKDDFCVQLYSFLPCKVEWCVSHWTYQVWHEYGFLTMAPRISSCTLWNFYGNLLYKNVGIEVSKYRRYFWQKYRSIEHFIRPILLEPLYGMEQRMLPITRSHFPALVFLFRTPSVCPHLSHVSRLFFTARP